MSRNKSAFDAAATILAMDTDKLIGIIETDLPIIYKTNRNAHDNFCSVVFQHPSPNVQHTLVRYSHVPPFL